MPWRVHGDLSPCAGGRGTWGTGMTSIQQYLVPSVWYMKSPLFEPEIQSGDIRAWVKCVVPAAMQDKSHSAGYCPLSYPETSFPSSCFDACFLPPLIMQCCLRGKQWPPRCTAINDNPVGAGGQHWAWHMGESGTEPTLPGAGTGSGAAGRSTRHRHRLASSAGLHKRTRWIEILYKKGLRSVKQNAGKKRKWTHQARPPTPLLAMGASIPEHQHQKCHSVLILNWLLLPVL